MNVPTLTMPLEEARAAFRAYRQAIAGNPGAATLEDRACLMGYRELARGRALIDLEKAMRGAGLDEQQRPRLAIARADWHWCWLTRIGWRSAVRFQRAQWTDGRSGRKAFVELHQSAFAGAVTDKSTRAMVPMVPAPIRPAADLANYFVLWEAAWEDVPTDPYLLRHLVGTLYAVLAMWDLTPLERAVMGARIR